MIYKVVDPDSHQFGYGPTAWDALSEAVGKEEKDRIQNEQGKFGYKWSEYRTVNPKIDGRMSPVANRKTSYEQCTVQDRDGDVVFEVYRALNMDVLKGVGIKQTQKVLQSLQKLKTHIPLESERFRPGTQYRKLAEKLEAQGKPRAKVREAINKLMEQRLNDSKTSKPSKAKGNRTRK